MTLSSSFGNWFRRSSPQKKRRRTSPRLLKSFLHLESLEERSLMAVDTFEVAFDAPEAIQEMGVWAEVSGKLINAYNGMDAGTIVYFDNEVGDFVDEAQSTHPDDLAFQVTTFNNDLENPTASFNLTEVFITGGQIVIGIGSNPGIYYNTSGTIATPTPTNNAEHYFGLMEYAFNGAGLDVDVSEVDQVGFPFWVTSDPAGPNPANEGVGIQKERGGLFNQYDAFIAGLGAQAKPFMDTISQGIIDGTTYRVVAPQDLNLGQHPVSLPENNVSFQNGGKLQVGTTYYYFVTAISAVGESTPSPVIEATPPGDNPSTFQTAVIEWNEYVGATGYRVYRSLTDDVTTAKLLTTIQGVSNTSCTDNGKTKLQKVHPPENGYTFSALNAYYNEALNEFFDYYETNEFELYSTGDGDTGLSLYKGYTTTVNGVQALQLHPEGDSSAHYNIYNPIFSTNTNLDGAPAPPSFITHTDQSPAQMVFAADGVFAAANDPDAPNNSYLLDLQNKIDSAFNRGLANNFNIKPNNWANNPLFNDATGEYTNNQQQGTGVLPSGTYYYLISATNNYGETTSSIERKVTLTGNENSVQLSWTRSDPPPSHDGGDNPTGPISYNIYRSQTPGTGYKLVDTLDNSNSPPADGYLDLGTTQTVTQAPPIFYAPGSTSNWYSAFWHKNSSTDSAEGVSINGLAYGFPYDDQGGFSTNYQIDNPTWVQIHLVGWGGDPSAAGTIKITKQPNSAIIHRDTTIEFQLLTPNGHPQLGGANVTLQLIGAEKGTYVVATDAATGKGSLTIDNDKIGMSMFKLTSGDDKAVYSKVFHVVKHGIPGAVLQALDLADEKLSSKPLEKILKMLAKQHV